MEIEKEQLLPETVGESLENQLPDSKKKSRIRRFGPAVLSHFLLFSAYATILTLYVWKDSRNDHTSVHPLPDLNIRYEARPYTDYITSPYAGLPSFEVDEAWHELLSQVSIRVSGAELKASNQTSVELPDGGGYMAWLGVHHELHCIKMLRQWNYRDHYHPNVTEADRPHYDIHADHCLDVLRSAAICHGDTTLTTFGWAEQKQPMLNTKLIPHKCVNWEALTTSIEKRVVGREEIQALVNPKLKLPN